MDLDLGHLFARFGPFALVALWALAVGWARRRRPAQRLAEPPPVAEKAPVPAQVRKMVAPPRLRVTPAAVLDDLDDLEPLEPLVPAAALGAPTAAQTALRALPWAQAIVLTEVLAPPLALRQPGTLHGPGAL